MYRYTVSFNATILAKFNQIASGNVQTTKAEPFFPVQNAAFTHSRSHPSTKPKTTMLPKAPCSSRHSTHSQNVHAICNIHRLEVLIEADHVLLRLRSRNRCRAPHGGAGHRSRGLDAHRSLGLGRGRQDTFKVLGRDRVEVVEGVLDLVDGLVAKEVEDFVGTVLDVLSELFEGGERGRTEGNGVFGEGEETLNCRGFELDGFLDALFGVGLGSAAVQVRLDDAVVVCVALDVRVDLLKTVHRAGERDGLDWSSGSGGLFARSRQSAGSFGLLAVGCDGEHMEESGKDGGVVDVVPASQGDVAFSERAESLIKGVGFKPLGSFLVAGDCKRNRTGRRKGTNDQGTLSVEVPGVSFKKLSSHKTLTFVLDLLVKSPPLINTADKDFQAERVQLHVDVSAEHHVAIHAASLEGL